MRLASNFYRSLWFGRPDSGTRYSDHPGCALRPGELEIRRIALCPHPQTRGRDLSTALSSRHRSRPSPCGLGAGNSESFAQATGLDRFAHIPVGEFILGLPADIKQKLLGADAEASLEEVHSKQQ